MLAGTSEHYFNYHISVKPFLLSRLALQVCNVIRSVFSDLIKSIGCSIQAGCSFSVTSELIRRLKHTT